MPLRRFYRSYIRSYGRSVLVIVRQVNAPPDMRRAARISMYCGITHSRQIISSLNYIFPRRTPVAARIYFAFTSSIDENKNRISRPFSASPLHRLRFLDRVSLYANCRPSQIFARVARKKRLSRMCVCVFNSQSFFFEDNEMLNTRESRSLN